MKPVLSAKTNDGITLRQAALVAGAAYLLNPVSYAAAWALYVLLAPVNRALSLLTAGGAGRDS